jgi:hypothetical protein
MRTRPSRVIARILPLLLGILLLLAACTTASGTATGVVAPVSTATPATIVPTPSVPTTTIVPTATPTAQPTAAASPSATPVSAVPNAPTPEVAAAVQAVIQRANQEQQQAFAAQDPTPMRDTAADDYYAELARTNQDLAGSGVTAIALLDLQWGTIAQQDPITVRATTTETWRTTYSDGGTEQSSDQNVYMLVQANGAWLIQADDHPDTTLVQPGTGGTGAGSTGSAGTAPQTTVPTAPFAAGDVSTSSNWSGYAATGGTFTAVSGTWTVPTVAAGTASGADATWVGIGGVSSTDLIQAGTEATVVGNTVRYDAWVEMLPQASRTVPLAVNPGDQITVAITQQANGTWLVAFQNGTTGQQYQVTETYTSSLSSAEWVEEAPSSGRGIVALDNFGAVQFTAGSAVEDGQQVSIAEANGIAITMINRTGQALATPSALTDDGAGFSVQRSAVTTTTPTSPTVPGRGRSTTGTPAVP